MRLGTSLECKRGMISNRTVLNPGPNHEYFAHGESNWMVPAEFDTERSLPAKEQFVSVVLVPRERTVEADETQRFVIHRRQILWLPSLAESDCTCRNRDHRFGVRHMPRIASQGSLAARK